MAETKHDRELIELLNELRVALPGVQVLFAFLLVVPFTERFTSVTAFQRNVYFLSFLCTTIAAAFLIAPTSYHRLRWRTRDKERMLVTSNRLKIAGTAFLALAMISVVFFMTDFLYGRLECVGNRRRERGFRVPLVRTAPAARVATFWLTNFF